MGSLIFKLLFKFFFILILIKSGFPQNYSPLVTDRPDFTESTNIVQTGRCQFEFGYTFISVASDQEHTFGELLARIPIHKLIELRMGLNSFVVLQSSPGKTSGLQDATVGLKIKFMDDIKKSFLGDLQTAVLIATTLPTGKDEFGEDGLQPEFKLAFSLPISKKLSVSSNTGYSYSLENGNRYNRFSNSLSLAFSVSDRVSTYLEYYGIFLDSKIGADTSFLNGGFTYLFTHDFQMDIRAGKGLNGIESEYFLGVGAGVRL